MISPDEANLGVKAIYVWAGFLLPTIIILYIFYPEVFCYHSFHRIGFLTKYHPRHSDEHISNLMSFMSEESQHGDSAEQRLNLINLAARMKPLWLER